MMDMRPGLDEIASKAKAEDQEKEYSRPNRMPWTPLDFLRDVGSTFLLYGLLIAVIALLVLGVEWAFGLLPR